MGGIERRFGTARAWLQGKVAQWDVCASGDLKISFSEHDPGAGALRSLQPSQAVDRFFRSARSCALIGGLFGVLATIMDGRASEILVAAPSGLISLTFLKLGIYLPILNGGAILLLLWSASLKSASLTTDISVNGSWTWRAIIDRDWWIVTCNRLREAAIGSSSAICSIAFDCAGVAAGVVSAIAAIQCVRTFVFLVFYAVALILGDAHSFLDAKIALGQCLGFTCFAFIFMFTAGLFWIFSNFDICLTRRFPSLAARLLFAFLGLFVIYEGMHFMANDEWNDVPHSSSHS